MTNFDFAGKVALVTGSSRGIGAEVLRRLVRAGAQGVVHYWDDPAGENRADADKLAAELGVLAVAGDVRRADDVQAVMRRVQAERGRLDVLVNNAGILRDRTLRKMTPDEWQSVLDTNLTGVFHGCKYGVEVMPDGGRVVNIASVAGLVGFHGQANYAAAKAGVIGMTRALAKELARRQITVNAVAPGIVRTPMLGDIKDEVVAEYVRQIPVGRLAEPADVANAVLFLASADSGYITGQVLPVTGGWMV